jgi:hypothetical protein
MDCGEDGIEFICVVKDGKFVYYTVKHNGTCFDVELDDTMICHFNDIEKSGGICSHD